VEMELNRLINLGVIKKIDNSDWGTPLVPVFKFNGKIHLCADYKVTLNKYVEDVQYPFLRIKKLYTALEGGQHFSKLDFVNAYNQLKVDEHTSKLLAWSTHKGIFKVNRLSYGIKPASFIMQREVEKKFQGIDKTATFLDDTIITGYNEVEHLNNLKQELVRCRVLGFKLNKVKCKFFQPRVKYLGYIIDKEGLQ